MTPGALIDELARHNVRLSTDGKRLTVSARKGALTPKARAKLAVWKGDIINELRSRRRPESQFLRILPRPDERYEPFPLTEIQRAYWVGRGDAFELGNVSCHVYYEVESIQLDLDRYNRALQLLIDRHDMLRAVVRSDGWQQVLERVPRYRIKVLDLRRQPRERADSMLAEIRADMSHQVMPADRWPLFDIRATRLDNERVRVHMSLDTLIIDVLSLQTLLGEWRELYRDLEASLPPLNLSFRDYVLSVEKLRNSKAFARSYGYWSERFATLYPGPKLPLAKAPSALTQPRFKRRASGLSAEAWSRLKNCGLARNLTPSGVLLAVFADILTRWSGCRRFALNVTLLNRLPLHSQVNQIVGDFTSLIPLEIDNSGSDSFEAFAGRVQSQLMEDIDHSLVGGVEIMRNAARVQGKASGMTLPVVFTSLLNQNGACCRPSSTLWMGEVAYGISQTPQVWLDHQVFEENGALNFHWDAVEELFPDNFVQDMFDAYCGTLSQLAEDERLWRRPFGDLVPEHQLREREAVNATEGPAPDVLLQVLFSDQAKLHPERPAVVFKGWRLTYKELDRLSNQVARRLRVLGARPGRLVAVVMEKGWEQVVAVLAVLKSGAAYLPIDPGVPRERLWYLLEHGEVEIALTQPGLDRKLEWPQSITPLCANPAPRGSLLDQPLEPTQTPDGLAYVIYTSGSTGLPKGAMVTHRGAVNTIADLNDRFGIGVGDKVLALSDLTFDLSVFDIFGALAAGATIIMPETKGKRDPSHWLDLMIREEVTVWNSVPALMEMLVAYCGPNRLVPPSLRLALLSGDWIPVKLPEKVKEVSPKVRLISLGGATEASIWSIFHPIDKVDREWKSIPYGRPLRNQRFHVFNERLEPCPVWVAGELYIGGMGLARGYWRDEVKTAKSFIKHPVTGERLYKTGDLGRYVPGGDIEFLGRLDSQVKIQGYRIELGEIESVLSQHPALQSVVVKAIGASQESKRLAAFFVPKGDEPAAADLSTFLAEKLPSYMIPSRFIPVETLPLNGNGKVNRALLPDPPRPDAGCAPSRTSYNEVEARISAIVAKALGIDQVAADADFFELGATSLEIVRIAKMLEQELGYTQKIVGLYDSPTVAGLVRIHERHEVESSPALRRI